MVLILDFVVILNNRHDQKWVSLLIFRSDGESFGGLWLCSFLVLLHELLLYHVFPDFSMLP